MRRSQLENDLEYLKWRLSDKCDRNPINIVIPSDTIRRMKKAAQLDNPKLENSAYRVKREVIQDWINRIEVTHAA